MTPEQAVAKLRVFVADRGYDFAEIFWECPEQLRLWAEDKGLPWDASWPLKHIAGAEQ